MYEQFIKTVWEAAWNTAEKETRASKPLNCDSRSAYNRASRNWSILLSDEIIYSYLYRIKKKYL